MYWITGDRLGTAAEDVRAFEKFRSVGCTRIAGGKSGFKILDPQETSEKEFLVISKLMKDVGSALESIANTLADGEEVGCSRTAGVRWIERHYIPDAPEFFHFGRGAEGDADEGVHGGKETGD